MNRLEASREVENEQTGDVVVENTRRDDGPERAENGFQLGLGQRLGQPANVQVSTLDVIL